MTISLWTSARHCNNKVIGKTEVNQSAKMQQANNIFFARFVSSQICDDRSQRVFLAQMTSCTVHYDVTYHPLGVDGRAYANEFSNAYPEVYKKEGRLIW